MLPDRSLCAALRVMTLLLALGWLSACGGGGSSPAPVPPPTPPAPPTTAQLEAASRFAAQATFGLNYEAIDTLARGGIDDWLEAQFSIPVDRHVPVVSDLVRRRDAGEFEAFEDDIEFLILFRRLAWWHKTVTANDDLRQRVAFALSEIFVVSDNVDALIIRSDKVTAEVLLRIDFAGC